MSRQKDWEEYENFLRDEELAEGTIRIYLRQAKLLTEELHGEPLTKEWMLLYRDRMERKKFSDATLNLHIIALNRYLKYISREDCMLKTRKIQKQRNLENVLSREEYQTMLRCARGTGRMKYYYIMKTMASTGIRVSELMYFTVESIGKNHIYVRNKGKSRDIYLPGRIQKELAGYCSLAGIREGIIFRGNGPRGITREAVYQMMQRMAAEAGIPRQKVHPHSFRHLFARTYMDYYGNIAELVDEKRKRMEELGF